MPRISADVEAINDIEKLRDITRKLIEVIDSAERLSLLQEEKEDKFKQIILALQAAGNKAINATDALLSALQDTGFNTKEIVPSIHQTLEESKDSFSIKFPF
jgi:hypothetical protein